MVDPSVHDSSSSVSERSSLELLPSGQTHSSLLVSLPYRFSRDSRVSDSGTVKHKVTLKLGANSLCVLSLLALSISFLCNVSLL